MQFSRVGEHTIKCVITEDEIEELGFSLEEIMSNGSRTQEFMNQIFDMAEQEFETKFDFGVKTVRADFLPDHSLSLTFSEHPTAEGMMEHLKDIVNGLLGSIPKEKLEEMKKAAKGEEIASKEVNNSSNINEGVSVQICFEDFGNVVEYSKRVIIESEYESSLYKLDDKYYLVMDMSMVSDMEVKRLSPITDEYANDIYSGDDRRAFIEEHGEAILKENAVEYLREL